VGVHVTYLAPIAQFDEIDAYAKRKRLQKNLNSDDHFDRSFAFVARKANYETKREAITSTPIRASKKVTTSLPKKGTTMNSLTQFRKISILPLLIALSLVALAPARATPSCGVNTVILALEHFPSGSLDLMCNEFDSYGWFLKTTVRGDSDLYIIQNTFPPGAHTGWHTHPGPSLITVVSGELTVYDAADPTCTPHVYHAGESFTDIGCTWCVTRVTSRR